MTERPFLRNPDIGKRLANHSPPLFQQRRQPRQSRRQKGGKRIQLSRIASGERKVEADNPASAYWLGAVLLNGLLRHKGNWTGTSAFSCEAEENA